MITPLQFRIMLFVLLIVGIFLITLALDAIGA
jgi:hypothetical protein